MRALVRSRARLIFFGCVIVAGYFVYSAVSGYIRTERINADRQQAVQQVQQLQATKSYLEGVHKYVASDAYVEQVARRQLGYVANGEVPFVVISPPLPQDQQPTGEWWQRLFPK